MTSEEVLAIFRQFRVILTDGHFKYRSKRHGSVYVDKDRLYPHTKVVSGLCRALAEKVKDCGIEVVVGPAMGGIILAQWVAYWLTEITGKEVLALYAEKNDEEVTKADPELEYRIGNTWVQKNESIFVRKPDFILGRGHSGEVLLRSVLVVEDNLTTGGSVRSVIETVKFHGGDVIGVGALCNRGSLSVSDLGVPMLVSLLDLPLESWAPAECPLCDRAIPFTEVKKR